jgi:hypothetical protein
VSVVKPVRPAGLDDESYHGAEAAAIYFLQLDAYMQATGDTTEWEAMSYKTCTYCRSRLEQARQIAERGDIFTGGETQVTILHTYQQDAVTTIWPIDLEVIDGPTHIAALDGTTLLDDQGSAYRRRAEVVWTGGRWSIVGIAALEGN